MESSIGHKNELVVSLSVVSLLMIVTAIIVAGFFYKRKKQNHRWLATAFIPNKLYKNNKCLLEVDDDNLILPDWLKEKKDMIFSQDSIEKGIKLGSGYFGAVFKGKIIQGNAVYV